MGERENIIALSKQYIERAKEKYSSGKLLYQQKMYSDSVSRLYYSVFLAARGLLLLIGEQPKTHTGLIQIFGLKFVKEKQIGTKYAKILSTLYEARQTSDYQPLVWFDDEETKKYLQMTEEFLLMIEKLYSEYAKNL